MLSNRDPFFIQGCVCLFLCVEGFTVPRSYIIVLWVWSSSEVDLVAPCGFFDCHGNLLCCCARLFFLDFFLNGIVPLHVICDGSPYDFSHRHARSTAETFEILVLLRCKTNYHSLHMTSVIFTDITLYHDAIVVN